MKSSVLIDVETTIVSLMDRGKNAKKHNYIFEASEGRAEMLTITVARHT